MTPLRILLVGDYPADPRLGSPKVLYRLAAALRGCGHQATVLLAPDLGAIPSQRHARDVASPLLAARAARRAARTGGPFDVVDASSAEGLVLALARTRTAAIVARSHGLEHLNYARMLEDWHEGLVRRPLHRRIWYPAVRMPLVAWSARLADRLVVLNARDREFAVEQGWKRPDQIDTIPHGVSDEFFRAPTSHGRPDDLLFCGSWDRVKGIDYLVRAFARVVERRPETRLTVLGAGVPGASVLSWFPERVRPNVAVHDRVSEREVVEFYSRHKALVMCSTFEGYGMVVPEAMSQQCAVVATPIGAAASLVRDGETGLLVPPRDPDSLSGALLRVLDERNLRDRLASAAYAFVGHRTWTDVARETLVTYERALGGRGRTRGARAA